MRGAGSSRIIPAAPQPPTDSTAALSQIEVPASGLILDLGLRRTSGNSSELVDHSRPRDSRPEILPYRTHPPSDGHPALLATDRSLGETMIRLAAASSRNTFWSRPYRWRRVPPISFSAEQLDGAAIIVYRVFIADSIYASAQLGVPTCKHRRQRTAIRRGHYRCTRLFDRSNAAGLPRRPRYSTAGIRQ